MFSPLGFWPIRAVISLFFVRSVSGLIFGFPYGIQKVRGVNLGGWLLLEPFVTPSLFDATGDNRTVDEWTFCQYQDRAKASTMLQQHWDTFITEKDFGEIAAAGLNHVRIPVGYWAFDVSGGEPFIQGQLPYLSKAITWAQKYGLKVIVDLHGAPGSQNGYDNSGQRKNFPLWHTNASFVARTTAIVHQMASMYKDMSGSVPIIAALNEPAGYFGEEVLRVTKQYWYDAYGIVRWPYGTSQQSNTVLMIQDATQPLSYWNDFMRYPGWEGVIMDTHVYEIFTTAENHMTWNQHIQSACAKASVFATSNLWLIVGEWSPVTNDCAKSLNGRGLGSRYDGSFPGSIPVATCVGLTGSASSFSTAYKIFLRQYWEAQVIAFEKGSEGWIQWTWKTEMVDEWSYRAGLFNGWIPWNPTDLMYRNICG